MHHNAQQDAVVFFYTRPLPNGRGSDSKACRINDVIGAPTVREG